MLTKQTTPSRPWIVMYPVDSAIHRINHYPVERWIVVYPVDSAIHLLNNRGLYFIRFGLDRLMKRAFREHPQEFVDYHHLELVDQLFGYVYAFVVLMMSMKFPRLFRFNRRMSLLGFTLKCAAKELLHFGIIFGLVFVGFSHLCYLVFSHELYKFHTFVKHLSVSCWESSVTSAWSEPTESWVQLCSSSTV